MLVSKSQVRIITECVGTISEETGQLLKTVNYLDGKYTLYYVPAPPPIKVPFLKPFHIYRTCSHKELLRVTGN